MISIRNRIRIKKGILDKRKKVRIYMGRPGAKIGISSTND